MLALVGASSSSKFTLLCNINGLQLAEAGVVNVFNISFKRDGKYHFANSPFAESNRLYCSTIKFSSTFDGVKKRAD